MTASPEGPFRLEEEMLGAVPVVDHFLARLGIARLLDQYVPSTDGRVRLTPATTIGVVIRNLALAHQPLYSMHEWAARFDPTVLGLGAGQVHLVNDDRIGRGLERLFDADRSSLLSRLVLDAVAAFGIDCSEMHNDSTSVRLTGAYPLATGSPRGGKPTAAAARGHSKDFRPDLEQLVWILTVSADGAVPIACRVASGNVEDSTTHIATWDGLCALLGRSDFRYVADCKLATRANMVHIDRNGGHFVTVLPANRKEDGAFRRHLVDHDVTWTEARRCPARRRGDPDDVSETTEVPWPSAEGFRIIWVRSSHKVERDADSRRVMKGEQAAFPQARVVAVAECGTHAIIDAVVGKYTTAENTMAVELIDRLRPGRLLLADRGLCGFLLWSRAFATGADLLWRAPSTMKPRPIKTLADGSWLAELRPSSGAGRKAKALTIRVIDYRIDDGRTNDEHYRLFTTILDPNDVPALDLAAAYSERWEIESTFDELKTHQRGPRTVLRSKSPDLVLQEVWGHLCCHYAIRTLMWEAADDAKVDPDRVSFVAALRIARHSISVVRDFSPLS